MSSDKVILCDFLTLSEIGNVSAAAIIGGAARRSGEVSSSMTSVPGRLGWICTHPLGGIKQPIGFVCRRFIE